MLLHVHNRLLGTAITSTPEKQGKILQKQQKTKCYGYDKSMQFKLNRLKSSDIEGKIKIAILLCF